MNMSVVGKEGLQYVPYYAVLYAIQNVIL